MAKNWYQRGKKGFEKSDEVDAQVQARREASGPRRFWLEAKSSAKVTFLDSPEFFIWEHNLKLGGKFFNFFTCIQEQDNCPICDSGDNPSYVLIGTVINHKKFTTKDGKEVKNQKMLFVAKGRAKEKLIRQINKFEGDITHRVFEFTRGSSSTECSTGEDADYMGKLGMDKLKKMIPDGEDENWLKPFDYEKLFAPKSVDELRKIVGMPDPVGAKDSADPDGPDLSDDAGDGKTDDDVSIDDLI